MHAFVAFTGLKHIHLIFYTVYERTTYQKNYHMPETAQSAQKNSPPITALTNDSAPKSVLKEKNSRVFWFLKPHEFWHPRVFEIPYYFYLAWQCAINRIGPKSIVRANYNLYHGEIGLGSKYDTQMAFNQDYFLPTVLIKSDLTITNKKSQILSFYRQSWLPSYT